ncbi:10768_t:CDS:10, partial [Cetraspora pellucida]
WRSRVELIQDFEFPEASIRVKTTRDGRFVMATGVYKPQIRVFEYAEMAMKFDRHTDSENINFVILSDDWTKSVLLQNDRTIEFHTQGGIYYKTRIPKFGRDLAYHYPTCDLLITAASYEVYRLNLNQGRFLNPISTDATSGVNVCIINPAHQLFGFGTQDGVVEFWDPRSRSRVGLLAPSSPVEDSNEQGFQVTAMAYRHDGLSLAVGTSTGHILLYDLRSSSPWLVKDHQYGYPIKTINWYDNATGDGGRGKVISADCKIMKIWDRENGAHFTSVEPNTDINDVCVVPDSGLIFMANEGIQIGAYYVPSLGPAPRWCSFLDNLTEEMEENPQPNIYDDYKFVTRKELSNLGMDHLIGTNVMKPYMHGFFVDLRLYEQAKLISNPFAYAEYREKVIKEKLEAKRESRIRATKQLPKVNKDLANRLLHSSEKKKKGGQDATNLLQDKRFIELFTNPEYEVDKNTTEYQMSHPTGFTVCLQETIALLLSLHKNTHDITACFICAHACITKKTGETIFGEHSAASTQMAPTKLQDTEVERHVDGKNNSGIATVPGLNIAAAKTTVAVTSVLPKIDDDHAAQHGNLHIAKNLIENGRVKATDRDTQNVTPLHWAAINNHVVMAKYLIDNGAEVDARGGELDATPLHWAARSGHLSIVTLLVNHGADPSIRDSQGFNGLHIATHSSNTMLVLYLIYHDMDIDTPDVLQHTPLMWAAYQGDPQTVELLINLGASVSKTDASQFTPLHWAMIKGNPLCLRKLIEAGANINAKEDSGKTPSDIAREMKADRVWERALHESGIKGDRKMKSYIFGKRITFAIIYLLPFFLIFAILKTLVYYPWYIGLPISLLEFSTCYVLIVKILIRAQTPDAMIRTPYLTGLFQASAFWVGFTWVYKLLLDFIISTPPYIPNSSDSCFLNDTLCGFFHYDMWTASIAIWIGLNLIWIVGLIFTQGYQIAKAKTTNEMANYHRYSYFGNYNNINVREQIMATLAAAPKNNFGNGDHRLGMRYSSLGSQHTAASLRMFSGRGTTRRKHLNDRTNGNPFDFGCWNNCVDFWSQGHGGMMQKIDWRELYDVPFERYGNLKPRNGYVDIRDDEVV